VGSGGGTGAAPGLSGAGGASLGDRKAYWVGNTKRVRKVARISPPMTTVVRGHA